MAQLAQRFRFDLADALARHVELAPDLFERARASVLEAEAQLQHATLAEREALEHALDLLLEQLVARRADRRLERDRFLRDLHDLADLVRRDEHPLRNLLRGRLAAELMEKAARDTDE